MPTVFLDANVFLYAVGKDHPLREASQQILTRVTEGDLAATTSTEVIQEILHVLIRRGQADTALLLVRSTMRLIPDVLPVTSGDMLTACDLLEQYPGLPIRDAVHAATMLNHEIDTILSADGHFELIRGIRWLPLA